MKNIHIVAKTALICGIPNFGNGRLRAGGLRAEEAKQKDEQQQSVYINLADNRRQQKLIINNINKNNRTEDSQHLVFILLKIDIQIFLNNTINNDEKN